MIWGHFYADPSDVSWGSEENPDLFVKIWFDASGRVDVNFFHVSVPDIEVFAEYRGTPLQGKTTLSQRYVRLYYNQNGLNGMEVNIEDGRPASGLAANGAPPASSTINGLKAIINTDAGILNAVLRQR